MPNSTIVINALERALSEDINNLQALATRGRAEQNLYMFAERFLVPSLPSAPERP